MFDIEFILNHLSKHRPIFHSEADFQHALAWEIQKHYPESQIRLETKVFGKERKVFLDVLVIFKEKKYALELKYKTRAFDYLIEDELFSLNNQGAQDHGRYDAIKDISRLEEMVNTGVVDEGIMIFLTNDHSYYTVPPYQETVDKDFRIHEGRQIEGELQWAEHAGHGTTKGREQSIALHSTYSMNWKTYSVLNDTSAGKFLYLMLKVSASNSKATSVNPAQRVIKGSSPHVSKSASQPAWMRHFIEKGLIPSSQRDFRDKLAEHLRKNGYTVEIDKNVGNGRLDIFADKGAEQMAIEVRYKTRLLQTMHQGEHIHLKNQGAHDVSRYDFLSDLEKLERMVASNPTYKGYALLLTNEYLYWQSPSKTNSVDADFHIYDGNVISGRRSWKEEASKGTTKGREHALVFEKSYEMNWYPYLTLGPEKNEDFRMLIVEVD